MGIFVSKEENPNEVRHAVTRVKTCLENHEGNVKTIDAAINAQKASLEMLFQNLSELKEDKTECPRSKSGVIEKTEDLLGNIQKILELQSSPLNKSFDVLENCIEDIVKKYIPDLGSSAGTDRPRQISRNVQKPEHQTDKFMYETEKYSADKDAPSVDSDDSLLSSLCVLRDENDVLIKKQEELQRIITENQENIRKSEDRYKRLLSEKEAKDKLQRELDQLNAYCRKLERENQHLKEEERKWTADSNAKRSLEFQMRNTGDENRRLKQKLTDLERQIQRIEQEKRRKVTVPVQLFYQRRDELMTLVVNELSSMLNTQMQTKNIQLEIVRCENISSIQPDKPILVLCINSSRLGTDASTAIEGVHKSGRTALLIFHHKNIHALPNQPSDRMLTSSEFKQLGGIMDLAFLTGKGIYPCDMNNLAVSCIESFIQKNISGK